MSDFLIDSPMAECRRVAWGTRFKGETHGRIWERAREFYGRWSAGKVNLGADYDRFRGKINGSGDAWEGEGGDVTFDVGDLELGKGGEENVDV